MHIYYKYKYLYFIINEKMFKNIYYKIMNEKYPQDWKMIFENNIINIDKENLIKYISFNNNTESGEININYIIFGYNLLIN